MVATRRQSKASQQHRYMRLPEVLLDAVLSYSDLRTRSLAVTTSHEFCESYARLAKTLEGRLVLERFPLLATCVVDLRRVGGLRDDLRAFKFQ